jgi:hypothetical protein
VLMVYIVCTRSAAAPLQVIGCSSVQENLYQCSVCDLAKIFLTSKFSYSLFSNLTHKTKTGTANRSETTNSKPPGSKSLRLGIQIRSSSQIVFIALVSSRC